MQGWITASQEAMLPMIKVGDKHELHDPSFYAKAAYIQRTLLRYFPGCSHTTIHL